MEFQHYNAKPNSSDSKMEQTWESMKRSNRNPNRNTDM